MDQDIKHGSNGVGHETGEASVRDIVLSGMVLAAGTVAVCFLMLFTFRLFSSYANPAPAAPPIQQQAIVPASVPGPHLQVDPSQELRALHNEEHEVLTTYGWVDKEKNIVRIPIDRAMDKLLAQGLPVRKQNATK
ncbi:MAG TPA: hypothetical protein VKV15_11395 [Bryobacteraceae bacterium]|nr:hypothetical protein [Bryobacteraceae bacterium]